MISVYYQSQNKQALFTESISFSIGYLLLLLKFKFSCKIHCFIEVLRYCK